MSIILSVNNDLDDALRALGHTVISVPVIEQGTHSCQTLWRESVLYPQLPDFFIQKEALARKIFFSDVHTFACKTVFWSIDTHLQYSWVMYYARLFDVFLTPHQAFIENLAQEWLHPQLARLAQCATQQDYVPHNRRQHNLNFVARLSGTRYFRQKMCQLLLERYGMRHTEDISFADMMKLYANTRIIPNESMANEVNFRLLEGAAVGACVISPDIGEDQNCLLTTGEEFLVYKDFAQLVELIDGCLQNPHYCEAIGRRAFERVQKEHLAIHRAQKLYEVLQESTQCAREQVYVNDMANVALFLFLFVNADNIQKAAHALPYEYRIPALKIVQELFIALKMNASRKEEMRECVFSLLHQASACLMQKKSVEDRKTSGSEADFSRESEKMLAVACGGAALYYEDASLSYFFLRFHQKLCAVSVPTLPENIQSLSKQELVAETALIWVQVLISERKECLAGSDYISGCCRTALDFTCLMRELYPLDMRWFAAVVHLEKFWKFFPPDERERIEQALQE